MGDNLEHAAVIGTGPPFALALPLDSDGRLAEHVSCRRCGYNLRGQLPDGRCPECGTAVGRSLLSDLLRFAEPNWLRTLAAGMGWIFAGITLGIVVGPAGVGLVRAGILPSLVLELVMIGVGVVSLVGYWKVTTPDRDIIEPAGQLNARKMTRIAQITGVILSVPNWLTDSLPDALNLTLIVIASVAGMLGTFSALTYARGIALRIPDDNLAASCYSMRWFVVVVMLTGLVFSLFNRGAITGLQTQTTISAVGGCGMILLVLSAFVWGVRVVGRFRKALREMAAQAETRWAADCAA